MSKSITLEKHDSSAWQPQEHMNIDNFIEEAKEEVDKVEGKLEKLDFYKNEESGHPP